MAKNIKQEKKVNYDAQSDVLYFGVEDGIEEEFVEVAPGVNVELNNKGNVIGVEVLNASRMLARFFKKSPAKNRVRVAA